MEACWDRGRASNPKQKMVGQAHSSSKGLSNKACLIAGIP